MKFNIITLFPDMFASLKSYGLFGKAIESSLLQINVIHLRDFAINRYGQVDDHPYGGGEGMVLMAEPLKRAIESVTQPSYKILLSPRGFIWNQKMCRSLYEKVQSENFEVTLVCGHYEGVDERVADYVDQSVSIGEYILSGGESAAFILMDSLARLSPGFMGNPDSLVHESYEFEEYIEYPQYTRPSLFDEKAVPEILLSGNHEKIRQWREKMGKSSYNYFRKGAEKIDE